MDDPLAPSTPTADEANYIQALLQVYSELSGNTLTVDTLMASSEFHEHFLDQRTTFYCAEGLKMSSAQTQLHWNRTPCSAGALPSQRGVLLRASQ